MLAQDLGTDRHLPAGSQGGLEEIMADKVDSGDAKAKLSDQLLAH